jgi:hypothetical protein
VPKKADGKVSSVVPEIMLGGSAADGTDERLFGEGLMSCQHYPSFTRAGAGLAAQDEPIMTALRRRPETCSPDPTPSRCARAVDFPLHCDSGVCNGCNLHPSLSPPWAYEPSVKVSHSWQRPTRTHKSLCACEDSGCGFGQRGPPLSGNPNNQY